MASTRVTMSLARGVSNPIFLPIWEGAVIPRGIELKLQKRQGHDDTGLRLLEGEFDGADTSIAIYTSARDQGYPLVALPIFTTRHFEQGWFHLSTRSDVQDLSELKGRRVGLHIYWISDAIWGRSILSKVHGVAAQEVHWITNRPERKGQAIPPGVKVEVDEQGRDTSRLILEGAVDAVLGLGPGGRAGDAELPPEATARARRPAYPDVLEAQRAYYRQTGVLPSTNVVVMREELASEKPSVVESLYELFVAAKRHIGLAGIKEALRGHGHWPLVGGTDKDLHDLLGEDPWPFGIEANRRMLETFLGEALEQGLIDKPMSVERFFAPNLPDSAR